MTQEARHVQLGQIQRVARRLGSQDGDQAQDSAEARANIVGQQRVGGERAERCDENAVERVGVRGRWRRRRRKADVGTILRHCPQWNCGYGRWPRVPRCIITRRTCSPHASWRGEIALSRLGHTRLATSESRLLILDVLNAMRINLVLFKRIKEVKNVISL